MSFKSLFIVIHGCLPRFCPICDAPYWRSLPLCGFCSRLVLLEVKSWPARPVLVEGLPVYPLFQWKEGKSRRIVEEVIYALKRGAHPRLSEWLVELWLLKFSRHIDIHGECMICPAPARRFGDIDHAGVLARAFSQSIPRSFCYFPLKRTSGSQKARGQSERRRLKLVFGKHRIRRYYGRRRTWNTWFIDDVVTSGGTIMAAHRALGKPENFQCLCIAYRPLKTD